ncbi:MAG: leishmanolysin-related zinc metalloendopeptidase [Gemmatimonadales bacterium]
MGNLERLRRFALWAAGAGGVALASCKGTEPSRRTPTTVVVSQPAVTLASIGATAPLTAAVLDQRGDTIRSATVTWSSNNTGVALVSPTGLVTAAGNGTTQVVATSGPITGAVMVTVAQVPIALLKVGGDFQSAAVGSKLAQPLSAQVLDGRGNPIAGVAVDFAVASGGGSLANPSGPSNASGLSTVEWTIGTSTQVVHQVTAAVPGTAVVQTFVALPFAGPPDSVAVHAGDGQQAAIGTRVAIAPAVRVFDVHENPVVGVTVTFAVASGGGSTQGATAQTAGTGVAVMGSWALGAEGENTLTATVPGSGIAGNPVTFTATGVVAGSPASVVVSTGDNQTGLVGFALNVAPAVLVRDANGFAVANAQVGFAVASGGGSVSGGAPTTDVNGVATVGGWTVQLGTNTLTATVPGAGITGNPATFAATGVNSAYHIDVRYLVPVSAARAQVFDSAVAKWQRLIYGDVPDDLLTISSGMCGANAPPFNETVDDVIILVTLDSIDGPGQILGSAGPCWIRDIGALPILGLMRFDTADMAMLESRGQFTEVILHEMGHVLGFGTIWGVLNLRTGGGGSDPHFTGAAALAAFDQVGGVDYAGGAKVPLENTGGPGTRDSHWRESVFRTELMTGFLNSSVPNSLSLVTVTSMADEGYTVNHAGADPYVVPTAALRAPGPPGPGLLLLKDDILRLPIYMVDRTGRVTGVYRNY